jgi:hypothetical protein
MHTASYRTALVVGLTLSMSSGRASKAEFPVVGFDVGWVVTCRDVTPRAEGRHHESRVIEAVFRISPELRSGKEADLKRVRYEIYSPGEQMQVKAFAPGSVVGSDVVGGEIEIESGSESGELSFRYVVSRTTGSGSLDARRDRSHLNYKLMVPKTLLQATGTTRRSSGVYFDLRPSSQDTLQEQREFAVVFEVPAGWRADHVTIECLAEGYDRGHLLTSEGICGVAMFSVGLHLEGDAEAKRLAEALARSQKVYFEQLASHRQRLLEAQRKTSINWSVIGEWVVWLATSRIGVVGASDPNLAGSALSRMLDDRRSGSAKPEENILPPAVQSAREELQRTEQALRRLNGRK